MTSLTFVVYNSLIEILAPIIVDIIFKVVYYTYLENFIVAMSIDFPDKVWCSSKRNVSI